ncbi:hypothetical protein ANN_05335 [Periplaneta americana]|uniref:C2H2-type domain-containing protein n=1 Tax=Periplaneta americana TaxID=6978 RepID=A0ABQ8TCV4_PERAM|nr:hypothetical protein ANN_05335 [Periplaneta americana]
MVGLCEGDNEPLGCLKAISSRSSLVHRYETDNEEVSRNNSLRVLSQVTWMVLIPCFLSNLPIFPEVEHEMEFTGEGQYGPALQSVTIYCANPEARRIPEPISADYTKVMVTASIQVKISCECGKCYTDQMEHTIMEHCKEHQHSIRLYYSNKSMVAQHSLEIGHKMDFDTTTVMDKALGYWDLVIKEDIEIQLDANNINRDGGLQLSIVWKPVVNMLRPTRTRQDVRTSLADKAKVPEGFLVVLPYPSIIPLSLFTSIFITINSIYPKWCIVMQYCDWHTDNVSLRRWRTFSWVKGRSNETSQDIEPAQLNRHHIDES